MTHLNSASIKPAAAQAAFSRYKSQIERLWYPDSCTGARSRCPTDLLNSPASTNLRHGVSCQAVRKRIVFETAVTTSICGMLSCWRLRQTRAAVRIGTQQLARFGRPIGPSYIRAAAEACRCTSGSSVLSDGMDQHFHASRNCSTEPQFSVKGSSVFALLLVGNTMSQARSTRKTVDTIPKAVPNIT